MKRCGSSIGFARIDCPVCGAQPQVTAHVGEDFEWYSYRKYKAVLTHIVHQHLKGAALTYRRIEAEQKRIEAQQKQQRTNK